MLALNDSSGIADLISENLAPHSKRELNIKVSRKAISAKGGAITQDWPLTVITASREEPDAPVASHLLVFDESVYEVGQIDLGDIRVKGNLIILTGSGGTEINGDPKCQFRGISREIVLKAVFDEQSYHAKLQMVRQINREGCL